MTMQDLALSVRETGANAYSWVILQGTGEQAAFAFYAEFEIAERACGSYSDALVAGFSRLSELAGRDGPRWLGPPSDLLLALRTPAASAQPARARRNRADRTPPDDHLDLRASS